MNPYWIAAVVPVAAQFGLFVRWLYRRMRDDEIHRAVIRDIATNHLPHIYGALRQIAERNGITLEEPPVVRYVEINGHEAAPRWYRR